MVGGVTNLWYLRFFLRHKRQPRRSKNQNKQGTRKKNSVKRFSPKGFKVDILFRFCLLMLHFARRGLIQQSANKNRELDL